VALDPTVGREMQKVRPAVIVSPDVMNRLVGTVIVAPMTTTMRSFPFRVACRFQGKAGQIALDHLRGVDKVRLIKPLGRVSPPVQKAILSTLAQIFS
jgi:mRNA interferase MazF